MQPDLADKLKQLNELHTEGVLTEAEYTEKKQQLLAGDPPTATVPVDVPAQGSSTKKIVLILVGIVVLLVAVAGVLAVVFAGDPAKADAVATKARVMEAANEIASCGAGTVDGSYTGCEDSAPGDVDANIDAYGFTVEAEAEEAGVIFTYEANESGTTKSCEPANSEYCGDW